MAQQGVGEGKGGAEPAGAEREQQLRADLAALRMERSEALPARRPRRRRRALVLLALAALALALGLVWRLTGAVPLVSVAPALPASAQDAAATPVLAGSGYIVPGEKIVAVGARVPGRVERFLVDEGDRVAAGQPLVQLDQREYAAAAERARARVASARARLGLARDELRRGQELAAANVLSQRELDVRESNLAVARAELDESEAALRQAELDLGDTVVRAPTDGKVLAKLKEAGEIAVPGGFAGSSDLVRLANLDDLRAEVDVNEGDLGRVRLGQRAEVTPDAAPESRYAAEVVKLYPQVDRQKGTLKVEVRILEPDARLLPDMSARVSFLADPEPGAAAEPAVLVPGAALRRAADGRVFVWVVRDGRARRVEVQEAGALGERVRLRRGLEGGEPVVVGDPPTRDGQRVQVAP